jgi:hypothetical protein
MIAEVGLEALWLAAGLGVLQFLLMVVTLRGGAEMARAMRSIAVLQGVLTLIAFAMLLIVFARSDMSVALVFENSNSAKRRSANSWRHWPARIRRKNNQSSVRPSTKSRECTDLTSPPPVATSATHQYLSRSPSR